jgi:tetratricopeptide (TPR) repeat protein
VGAPRGRRLERRLREASDDYAEGRYDDAARLARQVASEAPGVPAARELYGLTLYRLGRWKSAVKELEAFRTMTGSTEQHPVLADCYRALRRYTEVDELWAELREVSPSADLVTEGRIVAAGAQADRGELDAALRTLSQGWRIPSRPRPHHLRRAYALADLYERAGELPRARELFGWVAAREPDFGDVVRRVRNLG